MLVKWPLAPSLTHDATFLLRFDSSMLNRAVCLRRSSKAMYCTSEKAAHLAVAAMADIIATYLRSLLSE